jgi:transcriptional regulator with XRE-family HTH domain
MKIDKRLIDEAVLQELGERLQTRRFAEKLSQADLAENAGVSKRTVERIESGKSIQLSNLIRILRALNLLDRLDAAIPESVERPMDLIKLRGKSRQRVSRGKKSDKSKKEWQWGNE